MQRAWSAIGTAASSSLEFYFHGVRQNENKQPHFSPARGTSRSGVEDNIETMFQVIRHVNLFSKLDEVTQKSLCGSLTYETYKPKQVIFRYRDYGDKYYIILSGRVSVQAPVTPSSETFQQIAILESGSGFGEMALMENKPRAATVVCLEPTGTLVLTREAYQAMAMRKHKEMFEKHVHFLQSLPFLKGCSDIDVKALAEKLKQHSYPGPQIILRQGEEANQVILVESGTVLALRSMRVDRNMNLVTKQRGRGLTRSPLPTASHLEGGQDVNQPLVSSDVATRSPAKPASPSSELPDGSRGSSTKGSRAKSEASTEARRSSLTGASSRAKRADSISEGKPATTKHTKTKRLVLQVASLNRRSIYGAREILDGEKNAIVAERGNVYGVTLVAFPAAQVFSIDKRQFLKVCERQNSQRDQGLVVPASAR
ncbi:cyclic nucleotide-binding domain-containing protein [Cystoisospora suis]|uniref:Cyclic nucleotide-binding domain-containing protein n=1 Tax=Cystoisospora suis TaxID=483139 RepID=A0A2C6KM19_9APIC|nr:cyclic nucleotide-binding domain-containing protein [Cystoisospora suis]